MFASGDEAELAATLAATLGDLPAARAGAELLGDRVVGEYDWDAATAATEAVYEQVLHRSGSSRRRAR